MRKFAVMMIVLMLCVTVHAQSSPSRILQIAEIEKRGYQQILNPPVNFTLASDNFRVYYYRLNWYINPALRYISGAVTSYFTMTTTGNQLIYDLDNSLIVDSIKFKNSDVSFLQNINKTLLIDL